MKASERACGANISLTHYLLREFQTWKDGTERGGRSPGKPKAVLAQLQSTVS